MSAGFPYFASADTREMEMLRGKSLWAIALGSVLVALGVLALCYPAVTAVETTIVFGVLLVLGGIGQVAAAFWVRGWNGFFLYLLMGLIYLFYGVVLVEKPVINTEALAVVLAIFLVAGGLLRIVSALTHRFAGWGWALLNGVVTLLLGLLIWRGWPGTGLWVIGVLVGVELVFCGWALVMLGVAVRAPAKSAIPA
jgi:uncharacterized membrane protein HdeD (DUF308 family)